MRNQGQIDEPIHDKINNQSMNIQKTWKHLSNNKEQSKTTQQLIQQPHSRQINDNSNNNQRQIEHTSMN